MNISQLNDQVIVAEFPPEISTRTFEKVQQLKNRLEAFPIEGIKEIWSGYHTLAIAYDKAKTSFDEIRENLQALPEIQNHQTRVGRMVQIPVHYDENTADILELSSSLALTPSEIVELHHSSRYHVAMLGFQPGFPFLIGLPEALHHPRKKTPNLRVPKGSVAIGGAQTGIYPTESPGGWYILGQTPLNLFEKPDQFLLHPGDQVEFVPL